MSTLEILKQARALISKPENWTTGAFARDSLGFDTCYDLPDAVSFCSLGAIYKVEGNTANCDRALGALTKTTGSIYQFNDTHTHAEVLEAFDKAISGLEKETSDGT